MAVVGVLASYQLQQQRLPNGIPNFSGRRTFRIREKYVALLVFAVFGFVCFGGIFFLPDLRGDRVPWDEYARAVRPERFERMFLPKMNGSAGARNRHGRDGADDPHRAQDREKFRQRISVGSPQLRDSPDRLSPFSPERDNTSESDVELRREKIKQVMDRLCLGCYFDTVLFLLSIVFEQLM